MENKRGRKEEGNVLFNDALKTILIHFMASDIWQRTIQIIEIGNLLPPLHGILIPISSKGYFICTIPQTE